MELNRTSAPSASVQSKLVRCEPELLLFEGNGREVQRTITSNLTLHNKTSSYVAFKIKTTRPKGYCVRPNSGIIDPNQSTNIEVTMQAFDDIERDHSKHKFQIQALDVQGKLSQDELAAIFKGPQRSHADEFKIKCAWQNILLEGKGAPFSSMPVPKTPSQAPTPTVSTSSAVEASAPTTTERRAKEQAERMAAAPPAPVNTSKPSAKDGAVPNQVAGVKSAPLNVVLVLIAFVLGIVLQKFVLA
eukprot:TRINITY_DN4394_c0_g1_i3.p1 TRINITY_DN4394_c0_g1~~TRINITY_DN4394_c0_g1_i3.p1  ORF type:complete len:245 (+),score=63.74 TRINITY_DN4394_c0_g1_i3:172-906(+)